MVQRRVASSSVGKESRSVKFSTGLSQLLPVLSSYTLNKMSFAGRRRGNKVKKGVQFTVMVVGAFHFQTLLSSLSAQ